MVNPENPNPYVGPEPFRRCQAHLFFGRQRESSRLRSLVESSQEVLFYAPSGAGKTSLLQARLIPDLEEDGYRVLQCRVSGENSFPEANGNGYVLAMLSDLAEEDPEIHRAVTMGNVSLVQHLAREQDAPTLLILDQFEEILTTQARRPGDRENFFIQLRETLAAQANLSVLMTLREDHLAALERYARLLPERMRARYGMERLALGQAVEAIREPARRVGRPFAEGIAEGLADRLCQERRAADGGPEAGGEEFTPGEFVEPVQLQVVCYQLWESLRPGERITAEDLEHFGPIETALGTFYDKVLERVAARTGTSQQQMRRWFGDHLITGNRYRSPVRRGETDAAGLPLATVDALVNEHLVRREPRWGSTWLELVHDSFVQPIVDSNEQHFSAGAALLTAARAWRDSGRAPAYLAAGPALAEQGRCARENPELVGPVEEAYLQASRRRRVQRWLTRGATAAVVAVVLGLSLVAVLKTQEAEQEQRRARVSDLVNSVEKTLKTDPRKSLQWAVEAGDLAGEDLMLMSKAREALARAVRKPLATVVNIWEVEDPMSLAMSDRGERIATLSWTGDLSLWEAVSGERVWHGSLPISFGVIALSPDGETLAVAPEEGEVRIRLPGEDQLTYACTGVMGIFPVLSFSPDGRLLALGSTEGDVVLCDIKTGAARNLFTHERSEILDLAFSASGDALFVASQSGVISLWDVGTGRRIRWWWSHIDPIEAVAVEANNRNIASVDSHGVAKVWDPDRQAFLRAFTGDVGAFSGDPRTQMGIVDLAFHPSGYLIAITLRGDVIFLNLESGEFSLLTLREMKGMTTNLAFSQSGERFAFAIGPTVLIWSFLPGETLDHLEIAQLLDVAKDRLAKSEPPPKLEELWQIDADER